LVGNGRYRGDTGSDKTLWENFINTKRESEFIKVHDENKLHILTDDEIDTIKSREEAKRYNI